MLNYHNKYMVNSDFHTKEISAGAGLVYEVRGMCDSC